MQTMGELVEGLTQRNQNKACECMNELKSISKECNAAYAYMAEFVQMLQSGHSYVRMRALLLIAANAKWDVNGIIDAHIDEYLRHTQDEKPITARKCIQSLGEIALQRPALRQKIVVHLLQVNPFCYADSMSPLIQKDVAEALHQINNMQN